MLMSSRQTGCTYEVLRYFISGERRLLILSGLWPSGDCTSGYPMLYLPSPGTYSKKHLTRYLPTRWEVNLISIAERLRWEMGPNVHQTLL